MSIKVNGAKKITDLTAATTINDADVFMIETSSGSRKVTGSALKTLINNTTNTAVDGVQDMIAAEFNANNSYAVGDYVTYNGKLYRFTAAHSTGAFDGNDVTEVVVSDKLKDLISPTVTVSDITGGHRVTITDADHPGGISFDVMDGAGTELLDDTAGRDVTDKAWSANKLTTELSGKAPVIVGTASGAIASFADGADDMPVKELVVDVEPEQDLHGQDAPYPAGGGKNLFNKDGMDIVAGKYINSSGVEASNSQANYDRTFISVAPSTTYTWTGNKLGNTVISGKVYFYDSNKTFLSRSNDLSTDVNTITTPADCHFVQLQFGGTTPYSNNFASWQFEQGSSSTAYAPYSNICPISGWTGANVTRAGKNLADYPALIYGGAVMQEDGSLYLASSQSFSNVIAFKNNGYAGQITVSIKIKNNDDTTSRGIIPKIFYTDGTYHELGVTYTSEYKVFSRTSAANKVVDYIGFTYGSGATKSWFYLQIELGTTATDYETPVSTIHSITFPSEAGTIYGGTLNVTTGVLTVDKLNIESYNGETLPGAWISDRDVYAEGTTPTTGAQVVYELAAPITYTLTAVEIKILLGRNNIWADTGGVSVEYPADTKSYVDGECSVQDVQVNGTSVLSNKIGNVPLASSTPGVMAVSEAYGLKMQPTSTHPELVYIVGATANEIKGGNGYYKPINPSNQQRAVFFGLAKAAGADMASLPSTTVGVYPEAQKSAIHEMLSGSITISGATPTINALPGLRYICGQVLTLTVNLPANGCVDVQFESGSTPTVLTVNAASGQTVKWTGGFDPTNLLANKTYELNINNCLGVAGIWT